MTAIGQDTLGTRQTLSVGGKDYAIYSLKKAAEKLGDVSRLPFSMKVLLENLLRFEDGGFTVSTDDIKALVDWQKKPTESSSEIQYRPARVLLQDFTGVPCVVDLAAMRDAIAKLGGDTSKINPLVPVNLVIDHSVMVDEFGHPKAFEQNVEIEYQRNMERYDFLKWGSKSLANFYAVPPGTGICHQVNLENIAQAVWTSEMPAARPSPTPTPASARTATPRWSTASACSAGASAASRRKRRCSASRFPCSSPKSSASS
jgi:aconitate hydratase